MLLIQYWDSYDQLAAYATDAGKKHRPARSRFNRRQGEAANVAGVFHETCVVPPDRMETIYDAMTPVLFGRAPRTVPVSESRNSSRERLRGER